MFSFIKKEKKEPIEFINEAQRLQEKEIEENDKKEKGTLNSVFNKIISMIVGTDRSLIDLFPYKKITDDGYVTHKNGDYQAYLQITTYDLYSMNDEDLTMLTSSFQNLLRVYVEPIKIISLTYPMDTKEQQNFQQEKIKQYSQRLQNPKLSLRQQKLLENKRQIAYEELRRIHWAEQTLKDLTFFMVVYGETKEDVIENVRNIQRLGKRHFGLEHIKKKQHLENIISQLNNMNRDI